MKTYTPLHDGWTVRAVGSGLSEPVPAQVPGVVHTDLLAAGKIPDPYLDENEAALAWIGRTAWRYETTFAWSGSGGRHDLVCQGLDTLATIELNGVVLGRTANQHRPYRFDIASVLRDGPNELVVTFGSALEYAEQATAKFPRPFVGNAHPYNAVRKMACNFGWDWGPDLVTAGIWRPIGIESWHTARIASVRPLVSADTVTFEVDVVREGSVVGDAHEVTVRVGDVVVTDGRTVTMPDAKLWWPRGYGDQPLYDAEVTLSAGGEVLDTWTGRVGFRTIELDTAGGAFTVRVNGQDVFVRGANWIPDDAFPSRVDRDRYARRITDATDAGINLLRVWGGGIYESDDFYELCDSRGVMVWQDFLFACATYAEELLVNEVAAEARAAVTRLSPHPSLVLWCGNNENLWGYADWGWRAELGEQSWGAGFYDDLLPALVAELDPTTPYIPGSPYSPDPAAHPNDPATGPIHIWDVWNTDDYRAYASYTPRFVAEFGFQGPPAASTLAAAGRAHQKATDGDEKLQRGWQGHFPDPVTFDGWHWTTQLNQARAITFAIERFRSLAPYCSGTIVWQLNDCWPVVSWAAVDGYGRRKPLWYALRHAYADRLVTVQPRPCPRSVVDFQTFSAAAHSENPQVNDDAAGLAAVLVNDSSESWPATVHVRRLSFAGDELATQVAEVTVAPRQTLAVPLDQHVANPLDPAGELLAVDCGGVRAHHFFAEDIDLDLPRPEFASVVRRTATGCTVEITARTLLRDLALHVDRLDPEAVVDDQLVTLLPGERVRFAVASGLDLSEAALVSHPVLRTANDLHERV